MNNFPLTSDVCIGLYNVWTATTALVTTLTGGTFVQLSATTISAQTIYTESFGLNDQQASGFDILTTKVSLTAAQIQTLSSVPINIGLPPSGIGYYYRVVSFDANFKFGTIAFTNNLLSIGATGLDAQMQWNGSLSVTGNQFLNSSPVIPSGFGGSISMSENNTLSLSADLDSVGAVGDSTIDCYITINKVKL